MSVPTIDWKQESLADVLDPDRDLGYLVNAAVDRSRERFTQFCELMETTKELGTVSCRLHVTKGRFLPSEGTTTLFEGKPIRNEFGMPEGDNLRRRLRACLPEWEDLDPTNAQLFRNLTQPFHELILEVEENLKRLAPPVDRQNITQARLDVKAWKGRDNPNWKPYEQAIKRFRIERVGHLDDDLDPLYHELVGYNGMIDKFLSYGMFRTDDHFNQLNTARQSLLSKLESMHQRLSAFNAEKVTRTASSEQEP
jgi:hypothetical protein